MQIKLRFSSFEKTWDDYHVYEYAISPVGTKKLIGKELTASAAGESLIAYTITSFIMGIAIGGASSQVWGLINGLQLVVHLPLV